MNEETKPVKHRPNKPRTYFDYSEYDKTYNKAIDMVAACIGHYRQFKKPLKTIYLKPQLFDLFRKGVEVMMKREIEPGELLQFDSVNIERGSYLMVGKELYVDFWSNETVLN
jgi:hypothetical protein